MRGLGALANDTKWREFFDVVIAQSIPVEVKILYEESSSMPGRVWSPCENYLEGSEIGPELFVFIEWVRSDSMESIRSLAISVGLEWELVDGKMTVYGYR